MDTLFSILARNTVKNELCRNHTAQYIQHIFKGSTWALKMLDSSTKIPNGVFAGAMRHFGNFDECVAVSVEETWGSFRGQYCLLSIPFSLSEFGVKTRKDDPGKVQGSLSICLPSSCQPDDVKNIYSLLLPSRNITVEPNACQTGLARPYTTLDYVTIGVLAFFAVLCILSTTYDLLCKDSGNRKKLLTTFSWYTNGKALLTTKASKESFTVLQGIRFFSMAWVVYGHVYMLVLVEPFVNGVEMLEKWRDWPFMAVYGALFAVDTFFLLSGILVGYLTLSELEKGVHFNIPVFYLYRYLRVTPLAAMSILINSSLLAHLSSGPLWNTFVSETQTHCKKNWWAGLLYIQNFYRPAEPCQGVLWYLSADFQLYLLSPLLLIPLHKWPRFGLAMLQVLTVVMVTISYIINWVREVPSTIVMSNPKYFPPEYQYTHLRCAPWLIGISLGAILLHTREWRRNTPSTIKWRLYMLLGWTTAVVSVVAPVLCLYPFQQQDYQFSAAQSALFLSLSRPLWALGVSLLIFMCVSGCGGVVNKLLSCSILRPPARLTFAMYIIHLPIVKTMAFSTRTGVYVNQFDQIMRVIAVLVLTGFLSIVASLMFESPVIALAKILLATSQRGQEDASANRRKSESTNGKNSELPPIYELKNIDKSK